SKYFMGCGCDCLRDHTALFCGYDEWRRQKQMIAARAVHASLARISQDAALKRRLAHLFCNIRFARERLALRFVFYELDPGEQPQPANGADMAMTLQRFQSLHQLASGVRDAVKQLLLLQNVQHRVACSHCHWMRLVGESVLE